MEEIDKDSLFPLKGAAEKVVLAYYKIKNEKDITLTEEEKKTVRYWLMKNNVKRQICHLMYSCSISIEPVHISYWLKLRSGFEYLREDFFEKGKNPLRNYDKHLPGYIQKLTENINLLDIEHLDDYNKQEIANIKGSNKSSEVDSWWKTLG